MAPLNTPLIGWMTTNVRNDLFWFQCSFVGLRCRGGVEDTRLEAKAKDTKKNPRPRPRTAFPRTDTLEAKDRNARGQGQEPRTQAQVLSKKKKVFTKIFLGDLQKKRSSQKFFKRSPQKNVFQKIFWALHKILTIEKIVLSSSRGQANFRGLETSRPKPRTSKCVLEAKDVLEAPPLLRWLVDRSKTGERQLRLGLRLA